jgi:putative sterol carrier protein
LSAVFSSAWAAALERELAGSAEFRSAATRWKGALLFSLAPDAALGYPAERRLFLDLIHGSARAIRPALPADERAATLALAAPAAAWIDLLEGRLEAGAALAGGRFELRRGSLWTLLPHLSAARELLRCAQRVGSWAVRD